MIYLYSKAHWENLPSWQQEFFSSGGCYHNASKQCQMLLYATCWGLTGHKTPPTRWVASLGVSDRVLRPLLLGSPWKLISVPYFCMISTVVGDTQGWDLFLEFWEPNLALQDHNYYVNSVFVFIWSVQHVWVQVPPLLYSLYLNQSEWVLCNVLEQGCGTTLKLMPCFCLLHIFTQMIVMEMIMCLSMHIMREASPKLSVWDANTEMFYGLRHKVESKRAVQAEYTVHHLSGTWIIFCIFCLFCN